MTVFTWIETLHGKAIPASWEALAAGKMLADSFGVALTALVFGEGAQAVANEAAQYGATKAIVCEDATLKDYRLEPYAALLTQLVQEQSPKAVVAAATSRHPVSERIRAYSTSTRAGSCHPNHNWRKWLSTNGSAGSGRTDRGTYTPEGM